MKEGSFKGGQINIMYADGFDSVEEKRKYFRCIVCEGAASCENMERSYKTAVLKVWAVAPGSFRDLFRES